MLRLYLLVLLFVGRSCFGQPTITVSFADCQFQGSITLYDYKNQHWIYSDSVDAQRSTLPASTFKLINLLIALETNVIHNENDIVKWPGHTDTLLYGYRPDIYHDMTVREAFEKSAGWVFIELAKKIGRHRYQHYLTKAHYGNGTLSESGYDFWNVGAFGVSPANQVRFLKDMYEGKTPFSKRNVAILKRVMVTEVTSTYTLRSKTGWTRYSGIDLGWWVGYVEKAGNVFFFATRIVNDRQTPDARFGGCRKEITRNVLRQVKAM